MICRQSTGSCRLSTACATTMRIMHGLLAVVAAFLLLLSTAFLPAQETSPAAAEMDKPMPSLELMVGQMILTGFRGTDASDSSAILADIRAGYVGGVILFSRDVALGKPDRNIMSPKQLNDLTDLLHTTAAESGFGLPLIISIDQEGGRVARLTTERGFAQTLSAEQLAATGSLTQIREAGREIGQELHRYGINVDFAPVVDVNVNPDNPAIGKLGRSFGASPEMVSTYALSFLRGLQTAGVTGCIKHFPGHGSAFNDSHLGITDITSTWSENELQPFRDIILSGACRMVMTGHLFHSRLDSAHPATLSPYILTRMLRQQLGFEGVIITDDMQMRALSDQYKLEDAAILAIAAGADIILVGNNLAYDPDAARRIHAALLARAAQSPDFRRRIEESYSRIVKLKRHLPQVK